nr:dockerin type I repeat-containing protein [Clostridiales bacterium]
MKKILSVLITAVMLFSIALPAFAAIPLNSSNAAVHFESLNITVDPLSSAELTLVIEGLGTDPGNNQIGSIAFSSSNDSVNIPANCSPSSGSATSEGLAYQITASAESAGIATVTANVVDTNGNTYTCSCFVTVRGIVAQKKNVTLEVGETCIVFAKRYGLTEAQASKDMTWSKNGTNSGWISLGTHGTGRQNEAYFIKGISEGEGTVTVSLSGTGYSDTIAVSVVPKNAVIIEQNGTEVTSAIDLTSVSSASLDAVWEGFINPTVTWESSHPELVSVSQSGSSAVVSKIASSDTVVAVKATATENDITRTKTVYVNIADSNTVSLKITASKLSDNSIKIKQGETLTLSASALGLDPTATVWSATTEGGRVPLKLNSTVGGNITITGRLASSSPIAVTASNGSLSDTVYVSVAPSTDKSVKITGADLNADGFIVLAPDGTSSLSAELNGFSDTPEVTWTASIAKNSENSTGAGSCPVIISNNTGLSTLVTAVTASADFAKIQISVTDDGVSYTDEVYVKVNEFNIVNSARYVTMFQNNVVTLSTANGETADWTSNSQKTYFGNVSKKPTYATGSSAAITAKGTTMNPSRITIQQNGNTDSVYVLSASGSWKTVSFNLNGGYGKVPGKVTMSSNDTYQSIILQNPDAAYPSDNGEYIFYGWSDKANAAQPNSTGVMYFAGEKYTVPSNQNNVTLYAIWVKKTESALFTLRLSGDIGAEPSGHPISDYAKSSVYLEDALDPAGFYFNVNGVESHLAKVPSNEDIARALSIQYENGAPLTFNPDTDKVIWYVVKRTSDDSAGIANWHVDGVLVRGGRFSVSYNKNVSIANVTDFPNPPRIFYNEGDNVPITDLVPSCNDYRFIGWNTQPDGRGQWYTSTGTLYNGFTTSDTVETSFIIDKDTVLYAVWDGRMYYDVNEDGTEDINDIGFVISASAGLVNKKDSRLLNADFNGDGVVDGFDAAWLDRMFYSLGIISSSVELPQTSLTEITPVTVNGITPDAAIELTTAQTLADIDGKEYADWDIDLVLTFNKTVNKNDIYLFGQYGEYDWTGDRLADSGSISANEEYSVIHTWLPAALGKESFA